MIDREKSKANSRRPHGSLGKKVALLAFLFCASLVAGEVALRTLKYSPMALPTDSSLQVFAVVRYFWVADSHLGFRNVANGRFRNTFLKEAPIVTTDSNGFRNGYTCTDSDNAPVIVFVGDSTIFCAEVDDEHTGPSEVAKILCKDYNVQVVNAGVRGYSTLQSLRMINKTLKIYKNVLAAVYVACGNDFIENMNLHPYANTPIAVWDENIRDVRIRELEKATMPWGEHLAEAEVLSQFTGRLSWRRKITDSIRSKSAFLHLFLTEMKAAAHVTEYSVGGESTQDKGMVELLRRMKKCCIANECSLITTAFTKGGHSDNSAADRTRSLCREAQVNYVDIRDAFQGDSLSYAAVRSDGLLDLHYGKTGTAAFGRALAPSLEKLLKSKKIPLRAKETLAIN